MRLAFLFCITTYNSVLYSSTWWNRNHFHLQKGLISKASFSLSFFLAFTLFFFFFFFCLDADLPALLTNSSSNKSLIFIQLPLAPFPAHGWVRVSPVCQPLCAKFRPIICYNKCVMGRVTFTLIVCTQREVFPLSVDQRSQSIVSDFPFQFLATVCCFFSLSRPGPERQGSWCFQIGHCCE